MRYFIAGEQNRPEASKVLLRLEDRAPWALAEALTVAGNWRPTEQLDRFYRLGSSDPPIEAVETEIARQLVEQFISVKGRSRPSEGLPGDESCDSPVRSAEEQTRRDATWSRALAGQDQVDSYFRDVPVPPGASEITGPASKKSI